MGEKEGVNICECMSADIAADELEKKNYSTLLATLLVFYCVTTANPSFSCTITERRVRWILRFTLLVLYLCFTFALLLPIDISPLLSLSGGCVGTLVVRWCSR